MKFFLLVFAKILGFSCLLVFLIYATFVVRLIVLDRKIEYLKKKIELYENQYNLELLQPIENEEVFI